MLDPGLSLDLLGNFPFSAGPALVSCRSTRLVRLNKVHQDLLVAGPREVRPENIVVAFLAVDFLRVDAAFRVPVDSLAAVFLPDVFLAVDFFLRAVAMLHPLSAGHDAIRFRRLRSRSLIPPHTPYRSSRRRA